MSTGILVYSPCYTYHANMFLHYTCRLLWARRTTSRPCRAQLSGRVHVPRGSYPTPFLGYLVLWLGSVILKSRRPTKGVGYEPLGSVRT